MEIKTLGIDLAKETFQLHGVDGRGQVVLRKKVNRKQLTLLTAQLKSCRIVMEACATAHYWGRKFLSQGHEVNLIAAQFVKPFVKSQKNDRNDAEGIIEAGSRPSMRYVAVKQTWQQDIQALHRARQRAIRGRTAIINQIKGLLAEYGVVIKEKSHGTLRGAVLNAIEDAENEMTAALRLVIGQNVKEYDFLMAQVSVLDKELKRAAEASDDCKRLIGVPGVGVLGATAFIASVGDPKLFKNGRQVASWLGLVPKQHSTGGVPRLLSITKRGDPELRALLIHGARALILSMIKAGKINKRNEWTLNLLEKKGWNKTSVAVANKTARIMWHLLNYKEDYQMAA